LSKASSLPSSTFGGKDGHNLPSNSSAHELASSLRGTDTLSLHSNTSAHEDNHPHFAHRSQSSLQSSLLSLDPPRSPQQLRARHFDQGATYRGYLTKFSSRSFFSRKQWRRRYFILHPATLHCFKNSDPQQALLESLRLCAETIVCVTDIFAGKRYCLQITSPGEKNWYVLADSADEMSSWLRELKANVLRFKSLPAEFRAESGLYFSPFPVNSVAEATSELMVPGPGQDALISARAATVGSAGGLRTSRLHNPSSVRARSPSPPPRPPPPPVPLDLYPMNTITTSLSPPPRPMTPKSSTNVSGLDVYSGSSSRRGSNSSGGGPRNGPQNATRRRNNSSISSGLAMASVDYASFGTVMERADSIASPTNGPVEEISVVSSSSFPQPPAQSSQPSFVNDENNGNGSSNGSSNHSHRLSIVADRNDILTIAMNLPRRNPQKPIHSPSSSRPASPIPTRPISPSMGANTSLGLSLSLAQGIAMGINNSTSPRSSMVISPPPPPSRSLHRPVSGMPSPQPLQIMTAGLQPLNGAPSSSRSVSPANSERMSDFGGGWPEHTYQHPYQYSHQLHQQQSYHSISRITSPRSPIGPSIGGGSTMSRAVLIASLPEIPPGKLVLPPPPDRPLSPTPKVSVIVAPEVFANAPTAPLPTPPRVDTSSPRPTSSSSTSLLSSASTATSSSGGATTAATVTRTLSNGSSTTTMPGMTALGVQAHRRVTMPRYHDSESLQNSQLQQQQQQQQQQSVKNMNRSQSQESALAGSNRTADQAQAQTQTQAQMSKQQQQAQTLADVQEECELAHAAVTRSSSGSKSQDTERKTSGQQQHKHSLSESSIQSSASPSSTIGSSKPTERLTITDSSYAHNHSNTSVISSSWGPSTESSSPSSLGVATYGGAVARKSANPTTPYSNGGHSGANGLASRSNSRGSSSSSSATLTHLRRGSSGAMMMVANCPPPPTTALPQPPGMSESLAHGGSRKSVSMNQNMPTPLDFPRPPTTSPSPYLHRKSMDENAHPSSAITVAVAETEISVLASRTLESSGLGQGSVGDSGKMSSGVVANSSMRQEPPKATTTGAGGGISRQRSIKRVQKTTQESQRSGFEMILEEEERVESEYVPEEMGDTSEGSDDEEEEEIELKDAPRGEEEIELKDAPKDEKEMETLKGSTSSETTMMDDHLQNQVIDLKDRDSESEGHPCNDVEMEVMLGKLGVTGHAAERLQSTKGVDSFHASIAVVEGAIHGK
ncbi:hypothetical protein BGW38_003094, partial [Lunasporangiospora selenospora]